MSSARRTPRYVDVIRPFDVHDTGSSHDVIRLRPEPPGPALPPITAHWPRVQAVPVDDRPWKLLLVPPTPGAPTRAYHVARWQARLAVILAACVMLVVVAGLSVLITTLRAPELFTSSTETARLRARLTHVEDSLSLAIVAAEGGPDPLVISAIPVGGAIPVPAAGPPSSTRARAVATRRRGTNADATAEAPRLGPVAVDGLPVIGAIASGFSRARRHPILRRVRPHLGVDVAARRGTRISAPAAGVVSYVGRRFGFGLVLEINHHSGVKTRYAHLASTLVKLGDRVPRGAAIATVGTSGLSTGPHLHYEVLVRGHQVDPLRFRLPQVSDSVTSGASAEPSSSPEGPRPATTSPAGGESATPAPGAATVPAPGAVTAPGAPEAGS